MTGSTNSPRRGATPLPAATPLPDLSQLQRWAAELGFSSLGAARLTLSQDVRSGLRAWLAAGMHGDMDYMARHERLRGHPEELMPGAVSALMVTLEYTPQVSHEVAGADATYWRGPSPASVDGDAEALATTLDLWLRAREAGEHPRGAPRPWRDWSQATADLVAAVLGPGATLGPPRDDAPEDTR